MNHEARWQPLGATLALTLAACTASSVPGDAQPNGSLAPRATAGATGPMTTHPIAGSGSTAATPPAPSATAAAPATTASPPVPHSGPLASFHDSLRALERGERKTHVRILWLGDSHAQADFWPDAIRRGLQQRFGHGGPGFVHLGFKSYRHAGIETDIKGSWRMRPKMPSTVEPWGDGAFGLGGILHAGYAGHRYATVEVTDEQLTGRKLTWDLCYKHGLQADEFRLELGAAAREVFKPGSPEKIGKIQHLSRETAGPARLKVAVAAGRPDFCGLVVETDPATNPGVVLDNLGINGARYGTALAWNAQAWALEVKRRQPELFIFEYGGNEASDWTIKPQQYNKQALALIARARNIRPEASCLVIGPSDRADAESKIPPIVAVLEQAAREARCMFWNTYAIMGGKGSLRKWRDDERAAPDGVHLKPKGYAEVGALLLADMMAAYQR